MELIFSNLSLDRNGVPAVKHVSGRVSSGDIMAVLGPKGCAKTSLLCGLVGKGSLTSGYIHLGGKPLRNRLQEVAMVTTEIFFLPLLTVKETLQYEASLRLPPSSDRPARVANVLELFDLKPFAVSAVQFTAPAVQKRLAIACETLMDPSVLLVDEPVTGCTFEESINAFKNLKCLAENSKKIVIIATEVINSILYQMCSKVVFLHQGEEIYSGRSDLLEEKLQKSGLPCPSNINVVEFMLELLTSQDHSDDTSQHRHFMQIAKQWRHHTLHPSSNIKELTEAEERTDRQTWTVTTVKPYRKNGYSPQGTVESDVDEISVMVEPNTEELPYFHSKSTWKTPYWNQVLTLSLRNFRNARRRILSPVSVIQNLYILVLCVLVWWWPERTEANIMGKMGLFFFTTVQWAFFALLDSVFTFPKELRVVNRERAQCRHKISAYCLAKTVSEFPLAIIQPCVYMAVIYWVANLNSFTAFIKSVLVVVVNVFTAQSIGLFVGVVLSPPWTVSIMSLGLLTMMLIGGAFNTPPPWLQWGKYLSIFYYGLQSLIKLEFTDAPPIKCSETGSMMPMCGVDDVTNTTNTHFRSALVLEMNHVTWPVWQYVVVLLSVMVVIRMLWYLVLRFLRKPSE